MSCDTERGAGAPSPHQTTEGAVAPIPAELDLVLPPAGDSALAEQWLARAKASVQAVRMEQARAAFEQAVEADPRHLDARIGLGRSLLEPPDPSEGLALREFLFARQIASNDPRALVGEGIARQRIGESESAAELLEAGLEPLARAGTDLVLWAEGMAARSKLERAAGNAREAMATLDALVEALSPVPTETARLVRARTERGSLLHQTGNLDAAQAELEGVLAQLDPICLRAHHLLARVLHERDQVAEAERHEQIHSILRQFADGAAKRFQTDHRKRVELRAQLVQLMPEYPRARLDWIREMLDVQWFEQAHRQLQAEIQRARPNAELVYLRARAEAGMGRLDEAWRSVSEMRRLDSRVPPAVALDVLDVWRQVHEPSDAEFEEVRRRWMGEHP